MSRWRFEPPEEVDPQPVGRMRLGRAIDPSYPSNRAVILLAALGVVLGTWGSLLQGPEIGAAAARGLLHGLLVFFAWAVTRELDPGRHLTSLIAAAGVCFAAVLIPEARDMTANVLLLGAALMVTRLISESVAGDPTWLDFPLLVPPAFIGFLDPRLSLVAVAYALLVLIKGLSMGSAVTLVAAAIGLLFASAGHAGVFNLEQSSLQPVVTPETARLALYLTAAALLVFAGPLGMLPNQDGVSRPMSRLPVWAARGAFWALVLFAGLATVPLLPALVVALSIPVGALIFGHGPEANVL